MSLIIGIAGGSGSGKSTLARALSQLLPEAILLTHDDYYRADVCGDADFNYDHPSAFDNELLISQLDQLTSGEVIAAPIYDYTRHRRSERTRRIISPSPIIILEGILVLESEELRRRMDLKIFVDTPDEERLKRRIRRDMRDRGRSEESVIRQFESTVLPMHRLYVEAEKEYADILVKGGGKDEATVRDIADRILLTEKK